MADPPTPSTPHVVALEIDGNELAVRIAEAMFLRERPAGLSPADALAQVAENEQEVADRMLAAAKAAAEYFAECIRASGLRASDMETIVRDIRPAKMN